jgi:malonate-semialdehyde dehydrogenase (acetylating)/methylmalonate-semialdehyde dehydrogenase
MDVATDNHIDLRMRVGDKWVDSSQRETTAVVNPATGEVIAHVPVATADDAQAALQAASHAQRAWVRFLILPPTR